MPRLLRLSPLFAPGWAKYLLLACVVLGALALYLLATASANTALFARHYPALLAVNGALAVCLSVLLGYQLLQLRRRVKAGVFGSKLTLRLVLLFGLMAVLPGVLVYAVSVQFLGRSIESWFDVRIEKALDGGLNLGRSALDSMLKDLVDKGESMALSLTMRPIAEHLTALNALREQTGVREATLFSLRGHILAFSGTEAAGLMPELPGPVVRRQIRLQQPYSAVESIPDKGLYLRVLVPVNVASLTEETRVLQLLQPVPRQLAQDAETVQEGQRDYQELSLARLGLKQLYRLTLTLTLLLALLAALSLSLLLSERLSAPLSFLAEGTRAVAQGDFTQRAAVASHDELGLLTQSFNTMTRQLSEARATAEGNQAQLAAAKAYIESILANLSTGVLAFDAQLRLRSYNPSASQILGVEFAALAGVVPERWGALAPELAEFGHEIAAGFASGAAEWQKQVERRQAENSQMFLVRGSRLPAGTEAGFVAVFDDITHVLQAQRDAAWSEVARRLAHEIKNPLTPIQLSAERLQFKLAGKLAGTDAEMLTRSTQTIVNQVTALKGMVDAFREYARMPEPAMQRLDVNALVREVLTLYESVSGFIRLELAPGLPEVIGDPAQLRQVIHNLLQNAQDALVGQAAPSIEIRSAPTGGGLRITITDNGSGFPEHLMKRAFEPYVTTKPKGTGLGLVIVKKIMEEHGGSVQIENVKPRGARATLILPLPAAESAVRKTAVHV